jgi:large subunit ribosomal protein L17
MRHRNKFNKLSRTRSLRKALIRSLLRAIVSAERIVTTEAKAKALRPWIDKLIVWAKRNDLAAKRLSYQLLGDHALVKKLFDSIGPRYAGINGGTTRIIDLGLLRKGDCAKMSVFELTKAQVKTKVKRAKKKEEPEPETEQPQPSKEEGAHKPQAGNEPKKHFFHGVKKIFKKEQGKV